MPRSRAQATTLRRCSTGSTRPVGLDGEFSHSSAGRRGPSAVSLSRPHELAPGQQRADGVGRVRDLGKTTRSPAADPEQRRQPGDELLGADASAARRPGRRYAEPARQPVGERLTQLGRTRRRSGSRARPRPGPQRVLHDGRDRIDGRADGEVDDPVRVRGGDGASSAARGSHGKSGRCSRACQSSVSLCLRREGRDDRVVLDPADLRRAAGRSRGRRRTRRSPWCRPPTPPGTSSS